MEFNSSDLMVIAPDIAVLVLALFLILIEQFFKLKDDVFQVITGIGLLIAMGIAVMSLGSTRIVFNGMIASDDFTVYIKVLLAAIAFLVVLMSKDYLKNLSFRHGEYYSLILFATVGMMVLASATNLITMFLGIETMSIALYILAGIRSENAKSNESALKYFLLGAFSTGFLLYGIALLYGGTGGQTNFAEIGRAITSFSESTPAPVYLYAGVALIMIGLLFKVAAFPFHFWSPDVYQGAPTPVTAFMSAGPKAAALIVFLRFFGWALPDLSSIWQPVLGVVAAATMIIGNIVALVQSNIKRMLAYSSISHAGYLLLAVLAVGSDVARSDAAAGMLFYLVVYYLMNIGAFTVAFLINRTNVDSDYHIDDYQGLSGRQPAISLAMTIFMVSLAGIPPTAGFFGKLYVFGAAVKAGFTPLVIIGVLASVVSAFYYLRIVVYMYMKPAAGKAFSKAKLAPALVFILIFSSALILKLGIMPGWAMKLAKQSSQEITAPMPVNSPIAFADESTGDGTD